MSAAMGAPSRYSATTAQVICWQLTEGKSLRSICKQDDMPDQNTVFRWIEANESFRRQYARAREIQAHVIADETWQIVDEAKDGTTEEIQAARLRFDQRRWMAGKLLPKVYGDKMLHTGADGDGPVEIKLALDYSLLTLQEQTQMLALIEKATPKRIEAIAAPEIEGDASDVSDEE